MKILVYGAGVVGSLYAARLHEHGHEVTVLARGARLDKVREHGLVLHDVSSNTQFQVRVPVVAALAPDDYYDLVLIAVQKNQVKDVLPALAANHASPLLLFLGNNAAGGQDITEALGPSRVLLGFPGAGGHREGSTIHTIAARKGGKFVTTIGELDGSRTPRLETVAHVLEEAGFPVAISADIATWLRCHAAFIVPMAAAVHMAGCDQMRLSRTNDALVLMARAIRETMDVLQAHRLEIVPPAFRRFGWVPEPLLVLLVRHLIKTPFAETAIVAHACAARDEMIELANELRALVQTSPVPASAFNELCTYLEAEAQPIEDGSATLRMNWLGVHIPLLTGAAMLGLLVRLGVLARQNTRDRAAGQLEQVGKRQREQGVLVGVLVLLGVAVVLVERRLCRNSLVDQSHIFTDTGETAIALANTAPDGTPSASEHEAKAETATSATDARIGVYYGTVSGGTRDAAERIQRAFVALGVDSVQVVNIASADIATMQTHDMIIFGTSTYGDGELPEDWNNAYPLLDGANMHGKRVALFGLGDQVNYADNFQSGMGVLAQKLRERGAEIVGRWPTSGYQFLESRAVDNGHFVGLSLDYNNQRDLTDARVQAWVQQLVAEVELLQAKEA